MKKLLQYLKSRFTGKSRNTGHQHIDNNNRCLRILIIIPYVPYPIYTGGATRVFEKIKYFGSRHKLTVVSFYGSGSNKGKIRRVLEPFCENLILVKRGWPYKKTSTELPYKVKRYNTRKMWNVLGELSDYDYDVVMFEYIFTAEYRQLFESSYAVIEEHNIESTVLEQFVRHAVRENSMLSKDTTGTSAFTQAGLLRIYETTNWPLFNLCTTVSRIDHDQIKDRGVNNVLIVENGVNVREIVPVEYQSEGKILFMGHMSYRPNVEAVIYFVRNIFPILLDYDPDLIFCIAGSEPAAEVLALADNKNVECVVNPENMSIVAEQCGISVVPIIFGSGTRIKILHAMAMGLPVVSTSLGCEGLSVKDGEHLLIRDEPESFAKAVIELREDRQLNEKLRKNGRLLVEQKYDWEKIFSHYENELLQRLQL